MLTIQIHWQIKLIYFVSVILSNANFNSSSLHNLATFFSFMWTVHFPTLSFSSSRVPAVIPFLEFLLGQHTLKGRWVGAHTRLVTDLKEKSECKVFKLFNVSEPKTISHFKSCILPVWVNLFSINTITLHDCNSNIQHNFWSILFSFYFKVILKWQGKRLKSFPLSQYIIATEQNNNIASVCILVHFYICLVMPTIVHYLWSLIQERDHKD